MQYGCHGFLQGTYVIKRLRWPKQPIQSRSILWLEVTILISYKSQRVTKCSSSESFLLPDRNSSQKIHHHLCFPSDYKVKQHPWLSSLVWCGPLWYSCSFNISKYSFSQHAAALVFKVRGRKASCCRANLHAKEQTAEQSGRTVHRFFIQMSFEHTRSHLMAPYFALHTFNEQLTGRNRKSLL